MEQLPAIVNVRCQTCLTRRGAAPVMGAMLADPDGRWSWVPFKRTHAHTSLFGSRRTGVGMLKDVVYDGGVQARCRQCGHAPRFSLRSIIGDARQAAIREDRSDPEEPTLRGTLYR